MNRVPSAFTVGRIPISTCDQMYIGRVPCAPMVKNVTPKVSSETVKTIKPAANMPGVAVYNEPATRHGHALAHAFIADAFAGKL